MRYLRMPLFVVIAASVMSSGTAFGGGVPKNDLCENAIPIAVPGFAVGFTNDATIDAAFPTCDVTITAPGIWYSVIGTGNTMTATTCSEFTGYNTKISVYCNGCTDPICVAGNDDDCDKFGGLHSTVNWCSQAGTEYLILVHGFGAATGGFDLSVFDDGVACGPPDGCGGGGGGCGDAEAGSCFEPNETPACNDIDCCETVCAIDPYCCNTAWDSFCVDAAQELCAGCGNAAAGSCFEPNGTPGCDDAECCATVCDADPFCCESFWDQLCADAAADLCTIVSPKNDLCENAIPISVPGFEVGFTNDATIDAAFPICDVTITAPGIWYSVIGTGNTMTATTCSEFTEYNTKISVYCNGCIDPVCVAGNDDDCDKFGGLHSTVNWCSQAGTEYLILVHGFGDLTGGFDLSVFDDGVACGPPDGCGGGGGGCGDADAGSCFEENGTPACNDIDCCETVCAADPFCCETAWDSLCVDAAQELCAGCGNAAAGSCFEPNGTPGCDDAECCATVCDADPFCCEDFWDQLCADAAADLCTIVSPKNDLCENAIPIVVPGFAVGFTNDATIDAAFPDCDVTITAPGIWYSVIGTGNTMTATTCSEFTEYNTKISVYCNTCDDPTCVGGNDDDCDKFGGLHSTVNWCSQAGTEYLILVHGFGAATGGFDLSVFDDGVACGPPDGCGGGGAPKNDLCEDSIPLDVPGFAVGFTNDATIDDTFPVCDVTITAPGIWYSVIGTGNTMTATTCTEFTEYNTKISVYCNTCDDPTCVGGNDDDCDKFGGLHSTVNWCSQEGAEYLILVHGFGAATGGFDLSVFDDGVVCAGPAGCLPCPWDLDDSGAVSTGDLLILFSQWGTDGPADFDDSGAVGTGDLLILFVNWGPCP